MLGLLFVGNSVSHVKWKVAQPSSPAAELGRGLTHGRGTYVHLVTNLLVAGSLFAGGLVPWLALAAFAPLTFKVLTYVLLPPRQMTNRQVGLRELAHSAVFLVLIVEAYRISG